LYVGDGIYALVGHGIGAWEYYVINTGKLY